VYELFKTLRRNSKELLCSWRKPLCTN